MSDTLQIGQTVILSGGHTGTVKGLENLNIDGEDQVFYRIQDLKNKCLHLLPDSSEKIIQRISPKTDGKKITTFFSNAKKSTLKALGPKEIAEAFHKCKIEDMLQIVYQLTKKSQKKTLGQADKTFLHRALTVLSEVYFLGIPLNRTEARQELETLFENAVA